MRLTNLFLVGAAKAGSSSLWAALSAHPDIFSPDDELGKEPSFFTPIAENMGLEGYHALYAGAGAERYRLDASTAYLTHPGSAQAIFDYNPEAKVVILLRDPLARAYSLYNWMVAEGYEWAPSFERALELEARRAKTPEDRRSMPQYFWNYMYRLSGLYSGQVERYASLFGSNILLVNFHELVAEPSTQLAKILAFLELDRAELTLERENPSTQVLSPRLSFAARQLQQRLSNRFPGLFGGTKGARDVLLSLCATSRKPPPMKAETLAALDRYFAEDLEVLRVRYGVDLRARARTETGPHGAGIDSRLPA